MPLYNGNVNIIEGGNSLLQLYNYPPVIQFTTTGSNRVVFNIKQNVFCGGMELQWCKSNTFASGTITSSNINCTASVLEPLTSYRGWTETMGGFGSASLNDDGIYYMRVRGTNKVQFYPYLPTSSFTEPLQFSINRLASGSCYYLDGSPNYVTEIGGVTGQATWLPSGFNSSSQKWYSSAALGGGGYITSNLSASLTNVSGTIHKFGDERGAELNNEVIRFSNVLIDAGVYSSIYFDQSSSTTPSGVSFIMTTGSFRIGTSDAVDGQNTTPWFDVVGKTLYSNGITSGQTTYTLPASTGSFNNIHVYLCNLGGASPNNNVNVFLNGNLVTTITQNTPPTGRYIVFQLFSDSEFKFIGTRQDVATVGTIPSIQSSSLGCAFTS